MSAPGKSNRARPRRTLDSLLAEWKDGSVERRRIIARHWTRSVTAMLSAMLADQPEVPLRPMPMGRLVTKYEKEVRAWWREPFGPDGVPLHEPGNTEGTRKPKDAELIEKMVNSGIVDVSLGMGPDNPSLWKACLDAIVMRAWWAAWGQRHRAGQGGDRPEFPPRDGLYIPNEHWEREDYEYIMLCEVTSMQQRARSALWCKENNVAYNPKPMEKVFHQPLLTKVFAGEEEMPAPPPGQAPLKLPVGPNGRKLIREIVSDENGNLGCTLREQTEAEAAEEDRQRGWRICSWYDPPRGPTHREFMRPILEAYGQLDMLDQFSDELIQYDPPG